MPKPLIIRGLLDDDEVVRFLDQDSDLHKSVVRQFQKIAQEHDVTLDNPHHPNITAPELMPGEGGIQRMRVSLVWRVR